ncbi:class 3 adenylate cyclase/CheY-like chemotaxis protein [Rhodoligotrophos appendicifer]|uniref:adenylate/guanylate cyclase domain-containing protein n=1 Tax=Rhodoligotrophos appendicifer TaxID=987056 RepID=UPI001185E7C1|nr:adenylate/guanylate cyclase domain-containing protein [Rhodoligotrophos appendicifer]
MPVQDFERRARFAILWQDLITPVRAIVTYQEILVEEAQRLGLADIQPSLERVMSAAGALNALVDQLRDPDFTLETMEGDPVSAEAKLQHDLRTPLNAIIGYSEMVVEDLNDGSCGQELLPDLERLLNEARQLLGRIDVIVNLSRPGAGAEDEVAAENDAVRAADAAVARLMKTLKLDNHTAKNTTVGRILTVDDNESNREVLGRRLVHDGHVVIAASSGQDALDILERESFDLILLDLLMPGMNGIEVLERLKVDPRWRDTPVIMISGLSESDAVIRCIELGAEDYLPKPFNPVLLRARINASLERKRWRDRERDYLTRLTAERDRSEALLSNILPYPVVLRLNAGETVIADRFEAASILFADIVDFTPIAASMAPAQLVDQLNAVFFEFDTLARQLGVEKIKTIGDSYMAATGLPEPRSDHAEAMVEFARGMLEAVDQINEIEGGPAMQIRIGIHSGPVVAGIIGRHRFIYDVWGDTVNVASRLETTGIPRMIQVSDVVRSNLGDRYAFESRGSVTLKGRGVMETFLLPK